MKQLSLCAIGSVMWDEFQLLARLSCVLLLGMSMPRWHPSSISSYHLAGGSREATPAPASVRWNCTGAELFASLLVTFICRVYPKDIQGLGTFKCTLIVPFSSLKNYAMEWEQGFPLKQRVKNIACSWLPRASKLGVSNLLFCYLKKQPGFLPTHL